MTSRTMILFLASTLLAGTAVAGDTTGSYKPGKGFSWQDDSGENKISIGGRIQARYTNLDYDTDTKKEDLSEFTAERVRVWLKGHLFSDWQYKFQADFGKGKSKLKDASLTYARVPEANVSVGQFKTRADWQGATSSGKWQFIEESLANDEFKTGRDIGVMLHGEVAEAKFIYNIGLFNGEGEGGRNKNDGHLVVARVALQPNGPFKNSEGDIKRTDDHLWFVNLSAALNQDLIGDGDITVGMDSYSDVGTLTDEDTYSFGIGYRHAGIFLQGEYFQRDSDELFNLSDETPSVDDETISVDSDGWYIQAGYVFPGSKWELAGRYSELDPDNSSHHDVETETSLAVNRYLRGVGHSLKVGADVSLLDEETGAGSSLSDTRFRLQFQIIF